MSKTKLAVLLYSLAAFLTAFFMGQQLIAPLPRLSVHHWPLALGVLFALGAWVLPREDFAESETGAGAAGAKGMAVAMSPGRFQLRVRVLCALLLTPFFSWLYAPVRYSAVTWEYLCLMSLLGSGCALCAILSFTSKMRDVAARHCPSGIARLAGVALKVWLYGVTVPIVAILVCKAFIVDMLLFGIHGVTQHLLSITSTLLTAGVIPQYVGTAVMVAALFAAVTSLMIFCTFREQSPEAQVKTSEEIPCACGGEQK